MEEQAMELAVGLGAPGEQTETLKRLCAQACALLEGRLADGVTPEDCGDAFPLAAAWLAMDWLGESKNWEGVTSLTAGDMKVTRGGTGGLSRKAMELMGPWLRDRDFVFLGVRG